MLDFTHPRGFLLRADPNFCQSKKIFCQDILREVKKLAVTLDIFPLPTLRIFVCVAPLAPRASSYFGQRATSVREFRLVRART